MGSPTSSISSQFRARAGLPERKKDKPADAAADAPELDYVEGPEGGFGGDPERNRPNLADTPASDDTTTKPKKTTAKKSAAKKTTAKKTGAKK